MLYQRIRLMESGYEYQGARYQSLSEIARLITGTRWSGPLFFEIKRESANARSEEVKLVGIKKTHYTVPSIQGSLPQDLEQSFNSLDAQREACEAFIASQRHAENTSIRQDTDYCRRLTILQRNLPRITASKPEGETSPVLAFDKVSA